MVAEEGLYSIEVRSAAETGYGGLGKFLVDNVQASSIFVATESGGWGNWISVYCSVQLTKGLHTIRYEPVKSGYNLDWYNFTKTNATIEITGNLTLMPPINSTELTVTATDPSGIKTYQWEILQAPKGYIYSGISNTNILSLTNLLVGDYLCKVNVTTNSNDLISKDVVVSVIPCEDIPVITPTADKKFSLPKNSVDITVLATSNSGIASYKWEKISGPVSGTMSNENTATLSLTNLEAGFYNYRVTVISNKNCVATDDVMVKVFVPTGIDQPGKNDFLVSVYPNPAHSNVTLDFNGNQISDPTIRLIDFSGKILRVWQLNASTDKIDLEISSIPSGMYLIQISYEDTNICKKLVVE